MDDERFQQMEKRLNEQVEATQAMNETLNKFITIMSNIEAAKSVPPHLVSPPPPVTLMEIERKGKPSSHPVSCTSRSQHWISSTSRCTSTGHYLTSRADVQ
jgi:hypothetical protein